METTVTYTRAPKNTQTNESDSHTKKPNPTKNESSAHTSKLGSNTEKPRIPLDPNAPEAGTDKPNYFRLETTTEDTDPNKPTKDALVTQPLQEQERPHPNDPPLKQMVQRRPHHLLKQSVQRMAKMEPYGGRSKEPQLQMLCKGSNLTRLPDHKHHLVHLWTPQGQDQGNPRRRNLRDG